MGEFTKTEHLDGRVTLYGGDNRDVLRSMADCSVDSIVTDPPYALVSIQKRFGGADAKPTKDGDVYSRASAGFMGKQWDTGEVAFSEVFWAECLRVLKPGGHVVAFSGTRTYHRMAVAIEDAGFEIRDQLAWMYGQGFPKNHNISKALNGNRCSCSGCEAAEQILQYDMRSVRDSDVSEAEPISKEHREILQSSLPEQGSHCAEHGSESCEGITDGKEPCVEGRSDTKKAARKLRVGAIREMPETLAIDVAAGRLCDGAPQGDGGVGREATNEDGGGASCGSQSTEQSAQQSGTLAGQSQPQDGGAWTNCGRCGKPIIPDGIGTALKPSWEPICLARKPLCGTVAANVLAHGTGALNIDGCRVGDSGGTATVAGNRHNTTVHAFGDGLGAQGGYIAQLDKGRWPANIVHDGSDEVVACFPEAGAHGGVGAFIQHAWAGTEVTAQNIDRSCGSAARFFYTAKADKLDRIGSKHPTVKPVDLMQWLCRLVTPPGGVVLDPFAGSGSTGEAAWREGFRAILIEREGEYQADIAERLRLANAGPGTRKLRAIKQAISAGPLFGAAEEENGGGADRYTGSSPTSSPDTANGGGSMSPLTDGGVMAGKGGFGFRIRERRDRDHD